MIISIIVAAAENNVIGRDNNLIWHLSADLKHFKSLTMGGIVLMGRKTFESIGRPLPNRRNMVISRNPHYKAEGAEVYGSLEEAFGKIEESQEVFIIGGGTLYQALWDQADKLYLTRVHTEAVGDTVIPAVDDRRWEEVCREEFEADERNEYSYSFIDYRKKKDVVL